METDVNCRIKETSVYGGMKCIIKNRYLGMKVKTRLYEGVVIPVALYGADTWNTREEERSRLNVLEMRCWG